MPDPAAVAAAVATLSGALPPSGVAVGPDALAWVLPADVHPAAVVLVAVFTASVGASIGSFLAVVIERVPRGESIGGRSHCSCGRTLPWYENLPLLSWPLLGGRARCCGASIPPWYLVLEVCCSLVALAAVLAPGPWWSGLLGGAVVLAAVGVAGVTGRGAQRSRL